MPAMHVYEIERTQKVVVRSTNPQDALKVAEAYLEQVTITSDYGSIVGPGETVKVDIEQVG
jgi:hypothetical protein